MWPEWKIFMLKVSVTPQLAATLHIVTRSGKCVLNIEKTRFQCFGTLYASCARWADLH